MDSLTLLTTARFTCLGICLAVSSYNAVIIIRQYCTNEQRSSLPLLGPLFGILAFSMHGPWRPWIWIPLVIDLDFVLLLRHAGYLWREVKVFTPANLHARYEAEIADLRVQVLCYGSNQGALVIQPMDGKSQSHQDFLNAHFVRKRSNGDTCLQLRLGRGTIRVSEQGDHLRLHPLQPIRRANRNAPPFPLEGLLLRRISLTSLGAADSGVAERV